jgi:uncharacterized damage-inducible protein DinB
MKFKLAASIRLALVLLICLLGAVNATSAQSQTPQPAKPFIDAFQKRWSVAKGLAVAVADAMPAESYDFRPVPEEMSFGEQIIHIAAANYGKCAFIGDAKSPYVESAEGAKIEKTTAVKDLAASFDYCTKVFDGLDEAKLYQMRTWGNGRFNNVDLMLGALIHMTHHRGQAEVYLRAKGITPPKYKW